ncbi:MAG: RNA methyltransferase [Candidatus Cloacimonadales bacterium]|nr:RNA methyltransferase [Candidatus Cloacimonadales bacterium]
MNIISKAHLKELVKLNQKKFREQKVIVEGFRLIEQLIQNGIEIEEIFTSSPEIINTLPHFDSRIFEVENWQMEKLTSTLHPQNIAALVPIKPKPIIEKKFLLYLDDISEPGNLGTIFRTAAAADIDGLVLSPDCCEVYNPKVIRASLGSVFSVPHEIQTHEWLKNQDAKIISTSLTHSQNIYDFKIPEGNKILVLGSEAQGISEEILEISDHNVHIPISSKIESLNVAVAAGILIFHLKNAR